jgi:hypothetical protein
MSLKCVSACLALHVPSMAAGKYGTERVEVMDARLKFMS